MQTNETPNHLTIKGIKCDNPKCDYREEEIPYEDYEAWLGRECPECGDELLTEADLNTVKMMMSMVAIANQLKTDPNEPLLEATVEMDGTGKADLTNIKLKDN